MLSMRHRVLLQVCIAMLHRMLLQVCIAMLHRMLHATTLVIEICYKFTNNLESKHSCFDPIIPDYLDFS